MEKWEHAFTIKLSNNDIDDLYQNKTIWVKRKKLYELKIEWFNNIAYIRCINHTKYDNDIYYFDITPVILETKHYKIEDLYNSYLNLYYII